MEFTDTLTSRKKLLLRQVLCGDIVVDAEPFESFHILASVLVDVADDVGPPGLFGAVADLGGAPVRPFGVGELVFGHFDRRVGN